MARNGYEVYGPFQKVPAKTFTVFLSSIKWCERTNSVPAFELSRKLYHDYYRYQVPQFQVSKYWITLHKWLAPNLEPGTEFGTWHRICGTLSPSIYYWCYFPKYQFSKYRTTLKKKWLAPKLDHGTGFSVPFLIEITIGTNYHIINFLSSGIPSKNDWHQIWTLAPMFWVRWNYYWY